jgi:AcrR family transcriptional regulator
VSGTAEEDERRRPGRPRIDDRNPAILEAALALLVEVGFAGLSMEGIAARAGVGKATIYRRWNTKAEVVVEALRSHVCTYGDFPDTGDVRKDLAAIYRAMLETLRGDDGPMMAAFTAEKFRYRELRDEFERTFVAERRRHVRHLVERGIAQGDLPPGTNVELLADVGPALLWHRFTMKDGAMPDDLPEQIVAQFLPQATPKPPGTLVRGSTRRAGRTDPAEGPIVAK